MDVLCTAGLHYTLGALGQGPHLSSFTPTAKLSTQQYSFVKKHHSGSVYFHTCTKVHALVCVFICMHSFACMQVPAKVRREAQTPEVVVIVSCQLQMWVLGTRTQCPRQEQQELLVVAISPILPCPALFFLSWVNKLPIKDQTIYSLDFVGHLVSTTTTQLCYSSLKAIIKK